MRSIVAGQTAVGAEEFAELALGVDEELFAGVAGESAVDREARLDMASAVLAELEREEPELAAYARRLMAFAPVPLYASRRPVGAGGVLGSAVAA